MAEKPYGEMTDSELLIAARHMPANDIRHPEFREEFNRRVAIAQINAAFAQSRSAWFQLAAVVAMFLTVAATLAAPMIAHYFSN